MADRSFTVEMLLEWINKNQGLVQAMAQGKTLQEQTKGLREDFKKSLAQVGAFFERGFTGMVNFGKKAMVIGGLAAAAFGGMTAKLIQAGDQWNDYRDNIETVVKDQEQANKLIEYTGGLSFKLPFEKSDIQESIRLMTIFGYKPQEWINTFGDAALVAHTSLADITQAFGKARVTGGQSLRGLTAQLAITDDQLKAMGWSGKAEDITGLEKAMKALIETRFGGRMAKEMNEAKSAIQNLKNGFSWFMGEVGSKILSTLAPDLVSLREKFFKLYESGKLKEWAQRVADGFKMIWDGLKKAGEVVWKFAKPILNFFKEHPKMVSWAIAAVGVGGALTFLGGGLSFVLGKIGQLGIGLFRGIGQLKNFGGAVGKLFTTLRAGGGVSGMLAGKGGLLGGIGQIAGGLGGKLSGMGGIGGKIGGLLGGGGAAAGGAGGIVATLSAALPIIGAVIAAAALFATAWKKNFSGIREETKKAFQPLGDIARQLVGLPKSAGSPLKAIGNVFKETWQGLARVAAPIFNFLIKSMTAPFRILKAIATPIIDAIKKVLEAFGVVGKGSASGIKTAFEGLGKVFDWLFKGLGKIIDWIIEPIVWGIGMIVKGIQWLTKTLGLNKENVSKFGKNLKAEFEGIGKVVKWVVGLIGLIWSKIIGKIVDWFKGLVEKISGPVQKIGQFFKGLWDGIVKGAVAAWNWIKTKLIDPLVKAFNWLRDKVFKPIADFFGNLFKPLIDGVKAVFKWIGDLLAKAPGWLMKTLGITESDLLKLKGWVSGPMGPQKPAGIPGRAGEAGSEAGAPPTPGGELAGAGAGGSSGGGGPSINYWQTHNHYERGSIIINNSGDPAAMKKVLLEIFGQEALATT